MNRRLKGSRRVRIIQLTAGIVALFILVPMLGEGRGTAASSLAKAFIWGTAFLTTILLVWRERNQAAANRRANEEHARFLAVAETSPDAFFILDSVRNRDGDIVDFRYVYVNSHAEKLLMKPRETLLQENMCVQFPANRTAGIFDQYRKVVLTGEPLHEEFSTRLDDGAELWLRQRVTKLGDGVAVTTSDASEIKASEERYRNLSNFSNSVFESAPYSIIEAYPDGVIQAMNAAAERLTGYTGAEVVGKPALTRLHEPSGLSRKPDAKAPKEEHSLEGRPSGIS